MSNIAQRLTGHGRHGIPTQVAPGSHPSMNSRPAIARLSEGARLEAQIMADRPALVAAALLDGATIGQIAAALGWELPELRLVVGRWAPKLARAGQLTESQAAALDAIVVEPTSQ
jgi:hypothetical protein